MTVFLPCSAESGVRLTYFQTSQELDWGPLWTLLKEIEVTQSMETRARRARQHEEQHLLESGFVSWEEVIVSSSCYVTQGSFQYTWMYLRNDKNINNSSCFSSFLKCVIKPQSLVLIESFVLYYHFLIKYSCLSIQNEIKICSTQKYNSFTCS